MSTEKTPATAPVDAVVMRDAEQRLASLGISYGGRGPGGEFYTKDIDDLASISVWTAGEESWTADELEAIAAHKRLIG